MKSKNTKIQKILKKGILAFAVGVMLSSPLAYAVTSLDDSYLEGSLLDQLLYGKIGSTAKEIEEYFTKNPNKPLYITNETQLRAFAEFVNKGENSESGTEIYSCIGKEIILLNDIEIDRTNKWVPIGGTNLDKNNFRGTFDGRGHTIKGLAFTDDEYSYKYVGLFGIIGKGGTVKNLTTEDFNIRIDYNIDEIEGNSIYTTAAGNIAGACYGTIENCVNKSSIYGPKNVGGIVGYLANNYGNAKIIKVTNTGAVTGYKNVAGIVAYTNGKNIELINCKNTGQITGKDIIGGIIGLESGEKIKIENCVNKGRISGDTTGERIGGIVAETGNAGDGNLSDLTIKNCVNEGELNGSKRIGGIVGLEYAEKATIENCINKGKIKGTDYDIGGIVGYSQLDLTLKECLNKGQVSGNGNHIGGIVGKAEGANIQFSINDANVRGYNYVGGIVGYATNNTIIKKCHKMESSSTDVTDINTYDIIGVTYVGGIAGCLSQNSTISYCSNTSEVIGVDGGIGGIAGIAASSNIENSASIADILSDYKHITYGSTNKYENTKNPVIKQLSNVKGWHVGGIAGYARNLKILNCYVGRSVEGYDYVGGFVGFNELKNGSSTVVYNDENNNNNNYLLLNEYENFNMDAVQVIANNSKVFLNLKSKKYSCGYNNDEYKCLGLMDHTTGNLYGDFVEVTTEGEQDITYKYTYKNIKNSYIDEKIEIANTGGGNSKNENGIIETNFNNMVLTRNGDYIGANLETNQENSVVIDSGKGLVATFNVPEGYYKAGDTIEEGDTIEIGVTFNKKLYTSLGTSNTSINKDTAPKLTMKIDDEIIELDKSSVSINGNTTIVNYTKKITKDIANGKVAQLNIENSTKYWAIEGDIPTDATTYTNYEISSINKTLNLASGNIVIDTIKPIITTKVYVDNMLETDRYTAGKEIKFEVKTNERIQGIYTAPEIKVSFSGSGIGKYNYSKEKGEGFAKCTEAKINVDSTTTWKYSYQIQERDEGKLEFTFTAGNIKDLAGNETNIAALYRPTAPVSSKPIVGTEWSEDLAVTYEFYKNSVSESNRIVGQTYFTGEDDLIVVATYDKVLYVVYANVNKEDKSIPFSSTYLNNLPSLYLNADGNLKSKATSMSTTKQIEDNKQIEVTYKFENIAKNEYLDELTLLSKVALKNENNTTTIQAGGGDYVLGGQILYSTEYYDEYKDEYKDNLHIIQEDEIKTTEGLDDIIIDPIGVSQKIEKSDIYADTTAPTVKITADKENPTNANSIIYTFEFSEVVNGFEESDITVNGGNKATETVGEGEEATEQVKFRQITEGLEYTLEVIPTVSSGNEGILQVIVEEGAVKDLVAINNVRQENNITIDKIAPTVEITADKDSVKAGEVITYTLTFSEQIKTILEDKIIVTNGTKEEFSKINDSQATLKVKPVNGDDVKVEVLGGAVKDAAGNENLLGTEHVIRVIPTVTITTDATSNPTNKSEIKYTFTWSEEVTGFDEKDIILPSGMTGTFDSRTNTMVVRYNSLIPDGNEGEVTIAVVEKAVKDSNGNENVYTTNTLKIDRIAPIFVSLESYTESNIALNKEVDTVKEYYKAGDIVKIVATFSENIEATTTVPELALQFSESGNAKGSISAPVKAGNKITYTYTITNNDKGNDKGTLSVKGFSGEVVDTAGNKTTVTKRALDGDTIIADTKVPNLLELKVTSSKKANKSGDRITIEAVYDEEIYALIIKEDGKKEVVNITNENAPKLDISFGGVAAKGEMTASYGEDRKTIVYTYIVKGEEAEGDNGALVINKLENIATSEVCDIAGNTSENTTSNKPTNEVYADTKKPVVDSITAKIDENTDQFIKDTNIYHKAGNKIDITVKFKEDSEKVYAAKGESRILVGFSEDKEKEPSIYKPVLDLNGTTAERTYSYIIQDGDNGYLWVKVEREHYADEAGNKNPEEVRRIEDNEIYADTIVPGLTIYKDVSATQNGQTITVDATFSEKIYNLEEKTLKDFSSNPEKEAPIIIYGFAGATGNLEENASTVKGNVITYVITKENTISGEFYHAYFRGNVYDRAGNACLTNDNLDTIAPVLKNIEISSNAGTYHPYCKEGTEIYVTATFDEPITSENIKLEAKVGENEIDALDGQIVTENPKQVRFTYRVNSGDKDEFTIIDICGESATGDKEDYGWVEDKHGNQRKIYNLEGINPTGKAIADTENPSIKSVKAIINGKDEVATYPKEEGKDETARVNVNDIEYVVTFTELIKVINESEIKLYNGEKVEIINNDSDEDGYYDQITIKARTTIEGVQSLIIGDNVIEDRAGNTNALERFNMVTTDFTKPTVRFISEYNGGIYVLPTNVEKIEIRPNVEISEDIAEIYYKWKKLKDGEWEDIEPYAEVGNYTSASDIAIDTQTFGKGSYKLYIKVVDLAGNEYETKEGIEYKIVKSSIEIEPNTTSDTNQDVLVEITFGEGLTDNKKVVFKPVDSDEIQELTIKTINENEKYIVNKDSNGNGTIYVEATDRVGNKVYNELPITNIDTKEPDVKIELESANLIIGTKKDKATIKTNVELKDNMTEYPEAKYVFLQDNIDIYNMTEEQKVELKAKMVNELHGEAKIENAVSTKDKQPYYLYVLAKDKAGNEKISKAGPFTVVDTNEKTVTNDAGEESKIPAEIDVSKLISFEQKGKVVYITYNKETGLDIIKEKEISLTNKRDGHIDYENYGYVEVNGATTITVVGKDACGNKVTATHEVTKDSIEGPEFDVIGNPKNWTNQDVKLEISCYEELTVLTVNGKDILSREAGVRSSTVVTQNGDYEFIAIDTYGNVSKKTITVSKIDKDTPEISKVEDKGRDITITATDIINEVEGSGIVEYAISKTTEIPAEWSESNVIKVTEDGTFYAWVKDRAGNIGIASTEDEDGKVTITEIKVDTTAPVITLNYLSQTITVGMPIEANVFTNEDAIISYSWDKENWIDSEELITSLTVSEKSTTIGKYTLYAKAEDNNGNVSKVVTLEFNVVNMEEIRQPDIIFEDIPTVLIDGVRYIKVSSEMTVVGLTEKMNKVALCGKKPEFIKLTAEEDLKTGSEITLNGVTKYIIVIEGDMNCDGKVTFDDIVKTNAVRISSNEANITKAQLLAVDINNTAKVEFKDIISINAIRINSSK